MSIKTVPIEVESGTASRVSKEKPNQHKLKINEIFYSLQGESTTVGLPTVFIRLTGCPLRCQYCDTEYAFTGGEWMSIDEIIQRVVKYHTSHVTVTGGEPLAQKQCIDLLKQLCDAGKIVSLETSGAMDVGAVDSRVIKVLDLKTPGSKECDRNFYENIKTLNQQDQVKFVICTRDDYEWSKSIMEQYALTELCSVLFSPSHQELKAVTLAEWILQDQLPVRFQIQLHKYLWGDVPGH